MSFLDHPNVKALLAEAGDEGPTEVSMEGKVIQEKILHVLNLYPGISTSMLQVGIGTSIPPAIWKPHLEHFIRSGVIIKREQTHETPSGRFIQYTFLEISPLIIPEAPQVKEGDRESDSQNPKGQEADLSTPDNSGYNEPAINNADGE